MVRTGIKGFRVNKFFLLNQQNSREREREKNQVSGPVELMNSSSGCKTCDIFPFKLTRQKHQSTWIIHVLITFQLTFHLMNRKFAQINPALLFHLPPPNNGKRNKMQLMKHPHYRLNYFSSRDQ